MNAQLRHDLPLEQVFAQLDYRTNLPRSVRLSGLSSDSRNVQIGDAFVCLASDTKLQREYIEQALSSGARAVVLGSSSGSGSEEENDGAAATDESLVFVRQLDRNLSRLAGNYFQHPSKRLTLAGVTGTNGKSSVCYWVEQLFSLNGLPSGSIGTLGVQACGKQLVAPDGMTTRDPIRAQEVLALCSEAGAKTLAMEVSSHGMAQYRVEDISFSVAVFTNFSRDHLDYHGSEPEYWEAKKRLFSLPGIECAVLNIDDEKGRQLAFELAPHMRVIKFSADGDEQADLYLSDVRRDQGFTATLNLGLKLDLEGSVGSRENGLSVVDSAKEAVPANYVLDLPQLSADFELSNLLAALSASIAMGLPPRLAIEKCDELQPAPGRMQLAACIDKTKVYVDYAHTPDAVAHVLSALARPNQHLIVVLGCGGDRDIGKRPQMTEAALKHANQLIITSDNPRSEDPENILQDMLAGVENQARIKSILDREEAIRIAIETAPNGSCIAILGKGHEAIQIIGDNEYTFDDAAIAAEIATGLLASAQASDPKAASSKVKPASSVKRASP